MIWKSITTSISCTGKLLSGFGDTDLDDYINNLNDWD